MDVFEKIIEKLEKERKLEKDREGQICLGCGVDAYNRAISIVKEVAEEHNNGWILCSERMPEEYDSIFAKHKGTDKWCEGMFEKYSDDVNVTIEFEDEERMTMTLHTIDGKWPCDLSKFKKSYRVIAWQPLPQPYKLKECLLRKRKLSINLEDVMQIIIDNLDTVEMKSYLNIDKLLEALMVKAKEISMVDLEAIAAKIREEVAKLDKKQTNYERIISMSLEEIADAMFPLASGEAIKFSFCTNKPECEALLDIEGAIPESMCRKCLLSWLQQEA